MKTEITAIIIEDILAFHGAIEILLRQVAPNVKIIGNATSLQEASVLIRRLSPMLLLLDIQFDEEGKTAFDLLEEFSHDDNFNFQVIIITAHQEAGYYSQAFNYGALHFLEKPIDKQKLKEAIVRVQKKVPDFLEYQRLSKAQSAYNQRYSVNFTDKIVIEGVNYNEILQTKNIVYLEASGRYTNIYLNDTENRPICSSYNLGEFEKKLRANSDFFRIHRNKIINLNYVERFSKKDCFFVLCPPYEKQYASKDKFKDFLKQINEGNEIL